MVWLVFQHLSDTRSIGFSAPERIKVSEMLVCVSMTNESAEDLVLMLRNLDAVWMEIWMEKNPRK